MCPKSWECDFAWQGQYLVQTIVGGMSCRVAKAVFRTLYTLHSTLYTLLLKLYILHSTLNTLKFTVHFVLHKSHFTLYTPHLTLYTPLLALHLTLYTAHLTLYTSYSALRTLHFVLLHTTLYTVHWALYTLHSTLPLQFTVYTLHFTLYILHSTLCFALYTLYTVYTPRHAPHYNLHFTLYTLHCAVHKLLLYNCTPHSTPCTLGLSPILKLLRIAPLGLCNSLVGLRNYRNAQLCLRNCIWPTAQPPGLRNSACATLQLQSPHANLHGTSTWHGSSTRVRWHQTSHPHGISNWHRLSTRVRWYQNSLSPWNFRLTSSVHKVKMIQKCLLIHTDAPQG